jgi:hypothetical protein
VNNASQDIQMNNPDANSNKREQALLLELILAPIPKQSRLKILISLLSHSAWQGLSAVFGLLSLIVSIFLAIYIFRITNEQQIARIQLQVTYRITSPGQYRGDVTIYNRGPAIAQDVTIIIAPPFKATDKYNCERDEHLEALLQMKTTDYGAFCELKIPYFGAGSSLFFDKYFAVTADLPPNEIMNQYRVYFAPSGSNVKQLKTIEIMEK